MVCFVVGIQHLPVISVNRRTGTDGALRTTAMRLSLSPSSSSSSSSLFSFGCGGKRGAVMRRVPMRKMGGAEVSNTKIMTNLPLDNQPGEDCTVNMPSTTMDQAVSSDREASVVDVIQDEVEAAMQSTRHGPATESVQEANPSPQSLPSSSSLPSSTPISWLVAWLKRVFRTYQPLQQLGWSRDSPTADILHTINSAAPTRTHSQPHSLSQSRSRCRFVPAQSLTAHDVPVFALICLSLTAISLGMATMSTVALFMQSKTSLTRLASSCRLNIAYAFRLVRFAVKASVRLVLTCVLFLPCALYSHKFTISSIAD